MGEQIISKMEAAVNCIFFRSELRNIELSGNDFRKRFFKNIKNLFWKDCANAMSDFSMVIKVNVLRIFFLSEPIYYN